MKKLRILRKNFFITLFFKQNNWHKFSVLGHTFSLICHLIINKQHKMLLAGLLHDIGKPYVAFQDEKDKISNEYSFHNHEEISYHLIKNLQITTYTKNLVRYHYLARGMQKAKEKKLERKYKRLKRIYDNLDDSFKNDLKIFMKYDDLAKQNRF